MDLSFLKYDFNKEMLENNYSWNEILFALDNKIITADGVIDYATYVLDGGILGFDIVLDITSLRRDEDIMPYLKELVRLEEIQEISDIKNKWLYLILKWLYEYRYQIVNIFEIVEEIYELFDYPKSIVSFVRYMPSESGDLGSPELNRERLFKNWKNYIDIFEEEYLNNI